MSYRLLRACAAILTTLGWLHLIFFLALGFLPWLPIAGQFIPAGSPWEQWAPYLAPVAGLILGGLSALTYLVTGQLIRVFLDQRESLEELLTVNLRLLRIVEGKKRGARPPETDPFQIDQPSEEDLPRL